MEIQQFIILTFFITCGFFHYGLQDGQKSHGEVCSLRSQVANLFRGNDSPEGCMTSKGLVCVNHKCICMDPSNVFEMPQTTSDSSSGSASSITSAASSFLKNLVKSGSGNQNDATTAASTIIDQGGKCVGRAGSPCFTTNSTCVQHAKCDGSPRLCKCQGIYSSNTQGYCSKSATVLTQVIKKTVG